MFQEKELILSASKSESPATTKIKTGYLAHTEPKSNSSKFHFNFLLRISLIKHYLVTEIYCKIKILLIIDLLNLFI